MRIPFKQSRLKYATNFAEDTTNTLNKGVEPFPLPEKYCVTDQPEQQPNNEAWWRQHQFVGTFTQKGGIRIHAILFFFSSFICKNKTKNGRKSENHSVIVFGLLLLSNL